MPRDGIPLVLAFCIHGVRLKACVDTPVLAQRLRGILGPFETEATFGTDFSLDIRHEADPFLDIPPDGMQEYWRGTLPDGPPVVCYRGSSERETLLPGLARMRLTPRGADVWVAPGADWCLNLGCLLPALCDLLARRGHYVVHAATLRARSGTGKMPVPPALLLCGPGGVGKTTAALALARAGLQLLTDDATFLWCTPGDAASPEAGAGKEESRTRTRTTTRTIGDCRLPTADCRPSLRPGAATGAFHVWGLPRACKVHRHTVELMPWLRPLCECSEPVADEYLVELDALSWPGAQAMGEPAAVLFLEPRNARVHRLRPLDTVQAVACLADENVRAADLRGQGPAGAAFRALAALAACTPVYLLSVGPDIESLHDALRPLLAAKEASPER